MTVVAKCADTVGKEIYPVNLLGDNLVFDMINSRLSVRKQTFVTG